MQIEIGKIDNAKFYIDKAFRAGKKKIDNKVLRLGSKDDKIKYLEAIRLSVIKDSLFNDLGKILRHFPQYSELDSFYQQLFSCFIDVDEYKNSLGAVKWAQGQVNKLYRSSNRELNQKEKGAEMALVRNKFLARCDSFLKQIDDKFKILDDDRKRIREMPNIKTSVYTIAIAGFPNVGKSTLLGKLTDSKPEVKSYAFTTKGLMIGYIYAEKKIQIIDTPGTLNRFEKMNKIEKMAHLTMKDLADLIVYVFDLTEPYSLVEQMKLYQDLKKLKKEIIVYFSKGDIIETKLIEGFEVKGTSNVDELKEIITEKGLQFQE